MGKLLIRKWVSFFLVLMLAFSVGILTGCEGDDGAQGQQGVQGIRVTRVIRVIQVLQVLQARLLQMKAASFVMKRPGWFLCPNCTG